MAEKTWHHGIAAAMGSLWQRIARYCRDRLQEPEAGCGKCAICHRVCQLLDKPRRED